MYLHSRYPISFRQFKLHFFLHVDVEHDLTDSIIGGMFHYLKYVNYVKVFVYD